MDWDSFLINIYAGFIYFFLGIVFSIWLIPLFTVRLLKHKNHKFLRSKIAYSITSICDFFNQMPVEFRVNSETCTIKVKNLNYPQAEDFVAILKPDLFKMGAIENLVLNLLKFSGESESIDRYELMNSELKRIKELRESLEEITGLHHNTLETGVINEISQLCLEIRTVEKRSKSNITHEYLTGEKEGIHGMGELKQVYEKAFVLLKNLVKQRDFSII